MMVPMPRGKQRKTDNGKVRLVPEALTCSNQSIENHGEENKTGELT